MPFCYLSAYLLRDYMEKKIKVDHSGKPAECCQTLISGSFFTCQRPTKGCCLVCMCSESWHRVQSLLSRHLVWMCLYSAHRSGPEHSNLKHNCHTTMWCAKEFCLWEHASCERLMSKIAFLFVVLNYVWCAFKFFRFFVFFLATRRLEIIQLKLWHERYLIMQSKPSLHLIKEGLYFLHMQ